MKRKGPSMSPRSSTDNDKTYQSTVIDRNPSSENGNLLKERNIDQENVLKCKIYVCQACSFASKDKSALMLHEREQHFSSMSSPPSSPGPPKLKHICIDCCFETSSSNKFKKHRFKRHGILFIDNDAASKLLDLGAPNVISDQPYGTVHISPAGMLGDEEDFQPIKRARIPKKIFPSDSPLSHHSEEVRLKRPLEKEENNHQELGFNGCCRLGLQLETFVNKEDEIDEKDYNFISCHLGPCLVENGQHLTVHFQPIVMNGIDQALGELGKSQKLEEKSTASSSSFTEQTEQRDSSTLVPCAKILNKMDHLNTNSRLGNTDQPSLVSSYSLIEEMNAQMSQLPSDIKINFAALDKVQSELDMIYVSCCEIETTAEEIQAKIQQLEELEQTRGAEEIQLTQEKDRLTKLASSVQRDKWKAEHHLRTIQIKLLKTTLQLNSSMSAVSPAHTEPDAETVEAELQMNTLVQELASVQEKLKEVSEELANVCESRQCATQLLEVFREELKRNTTQKKSLMVRQLIAYDRMKQLKAEQEARIAEYVRLKEQDAFLHYKNVETKLELKEKDMMAALSSAIPVSEENV